MLTGEIYEVICKNVRNFYLVPRQAPGLVRNSSRSKFGKLFSHTRFTFLYFYSFCIVDETLNLTLQVLNVLARQLSPRRRSEKWQLEKQLKPMPELEEQDKGRKEVTRN